MRVLPFWLPPLGQNVPVAHFEWRLAVLCTAAIGKLSDTPHYLPRRPHVYDAIFLLFSGGIKTLIDVRYLITPLPPLPMGKFQNRFFSPMEIIGNEGHLLIEFAFRIKPYPSPVKFRGTSNVFPQSGHTAVMVGGSISFIFWYMS